MDSPHNGDEEWERWLWWVEDGRDEWWEEECANQRDIDAMWYEYDMENSC